MTQQIPLVDLSLQTTEVELEVTEGIAEVIRSGAFVLGPKVVEFESAYAAFCGVPHCVGVGNGTDAIELALRGAGVGAGDDVIIPANTFVATAEAVLRSGANLVLADCDEDFLLDPGRVAESVTPQTRAVIGVDLYGQIAPFEALAEVLPSDVVLMEDAAQSQGATRHSVSAGAFGVAAATSFYPGKNLGAFGDAGAVTTSDDEIADRVRSLRSHGGQRRYEHALLGTNSRLDSIQAVALSAKLRRLVDWNKQRSEAADRYAQLLANVPGIRLPRAIEGNTHVWHLYVVRVPQRDRVLDYLLQAGIGAGLHYPTPINLLPPFAHLGLDAGSFPIAERLADEILSLPIFPGISVSQQERVVEVLRDALAHVAR